MDHLKILVESWYKLQTDSARGEAGKLYNVFAVSSTEEYLILISAGWYSFDNFSCADFIFKILKTKFAEN